MTSGKLLKLAYFALDVRNLGPGARIGIWVQGCSRKCPHCIAETWRSPEAFEKIETDRLTERILGKKGFRGLTISGGEPMLQAPALVRLWKNLLSARPEIDLVVFSGYRSREILSTGKRSQKELLYAADAFIGGRYVHSRNDGIGLRGSSNQEILFPPEGRFSKAEREEIRTKRPPIEFRLDGERVALIGIPSPGDKIPIEVLTEFGRKPE